MKAILFCSFIALGISLLSCDKDGSPAPYSCMQGTVVMHSPCDGAIIKLIDPDPELLAKLDYKSNSEKGLVSVFDSFADSVAVGNQITFNLRIPTEQEKTYKMCLAIYPTYSFPQVLLDAPSCN